MHTCFRLRKVVSRFVGVIIPTFLLFLQNALAQPPTPVSGFPQANDVVRTYAQDATYMYIGGDFNAIGTPSNPLLYTNLAKCTTTNSLPDPNVGLPIGTIKAIVADGAGGFYVGGQFVSSSPVSRNRVLHILANGSIDAAWNLVSINGDVFALAFDGTDLYVGGVFTTIGGQSRNRIAKLSGATGAVDLTWNANITASSNVRTILANGADVYIGGTFTTVGGQTRNNVAKLDATTGAVDMTWNPNASATVESLALYSGQIYMGGSFTTINGTLRSSIARVNATTGALDVVWDPGANAVVYSIVPSAAGIYVGGNFGIAGNQVRKKIARVSASGLGGADLTWDPGLDPISDMISSVYVIRVVGSDVYVGGSFQRMGGQFVTNCVKLDATTGNADATWQPHRASQVEGLDVDGAGNVLIGGGTSSGSVGGYNVTGVARIIKATKALDLTWKPFIRTPVVRSLLLSGADIFVGGFYNRVNNTLINNIAKISTITAALDLGWNPLGANSDVNGIVTDGTNIFVGGNFSGIGGQARGKTAKLLLANPGTVDAMWNQTANNLINSVEYDGAGNVYFGGDFTTIGGQSRGRIARLSTSGVGTVDATWNPNANNTVTEILISGTDVYVAGTFNSIGGQTRNRVAKVSASGTGAADATWNPNASGNVFALAQYGADIYLGGNFAMVSGQSRSKLAKVSAATGALDMMWNPIANGDVNEFAVDAANQHLYCGGAFTTMNSGAITNRSLSVLPVTLAPSFTYYYESGDPNLPTSWGTQMGAGLGTAATVFNNTGDIFIVEGGTTTSPATGNIPLGLGVTLQVKGVLNTNTFAVTGAGNFLLNPNATLATSNINGINGTFVGTGAVQVTGTIDYDPTANYAFTTPAGPDRNTNFGAVAPNKPVITTMNKLKFSGAGTRLLNNAITVNDSCLINARLVTHSALGSSMTFNGAAVLNNVQLWHNGTITIGATGSFTVNGMSAELTLVGPSGGGGAGTGSVTKLGTNGVSYVGMPLLSMIAGYVGTTNDAFFPPTLDARFNPGGGTIVTLNDSKTVTGAVQVDGVLHCGTGPNFIHNFSAPTTLTSGASRIDLAGQELIMNGITNTMSGFIRGSTASRLKVRGTVTGSVLFETMFQTLDSLTLDCSGIATLGSPLTVQSGIRLLSGRLLTSAINTLTLNNPSVNALSGGSSSAFIDGTFERILEANLTSDGTHYFFPIGLAGSYRPLTLRDTRTGVNQTLMRCTGYGSGATTSLPPLASVQSPNWELTAIAGTFNSATLELDASGASGGYGVGMSSAQVGAYSSILATTGGATRLSTPQAATLAGVGIPRYFALGIVGPVITTIDPIEIDSGRVVTITGSFLDGVTSIGFGGIVGTLLTVSSNRITARVEGGASGFVTLISNVGVIQSSQRLVYTALPSITGFTPSVGTTNSTITITGRRFGSVQSVSFGGVPAIAAQIISSSEIRATVSSNGASGLVSMSSPYGTTTSTQNFTFDRRPHISSFSPEFARPQDTVRILGSHFSGTSRVLLGTTEFPRFQLISPTEVRVVIDAPFPSGIITLENAVGTAATLNVLTYAPAPAITSITALNAVDQAFTIRGTGFIGLPLVSILQNGINTTAASVSIVSPTELRVVFTTATVGLLSVQTYGGAATTASVITVLGKPTITAVAPTSLLPSERVTVTGANFTNIQSVQIGGTVVAFQSVSPTELSLTIPFSPVGLTGAVTVRTLGGVTTSTQIVRVLAPPTISSLQPTTVLTGATLMIFGTNFRNVTAVRIAGVSAQFTVDASASLITAIVPVSSTLGNVRVIVQTADGTADADAQLVLPPTPTPVITGFSPNPVREGEVLTISGANFPVGTTMTVTIGSLTTTTIQVTSSTQVSMLVPANALGVATSFAQVSISITSRFGTTTAQLQATVNASAIPAFTDFSPKRGTSTSGITLFGENLGTEPRGRIDSIRIGGIIVASFALKSASELVLIPGNVRTGRIELFTPFGVLTSQDDFTPDTVKAAPIPTVVLKDSLAMLALYRATDGDNWTRRENWLRTDVPLSAWHGVRIVAGRVVEVRLAGNNLRGVLRNALQDLDSLLVLDLSNNVLTGEVGNFLCSHGLLEDLNLSGNFFTGGLPQCWQNFPRLTTLNLSNNALSDTLPVSLGSLPALMTLNLSGNRLRGALPSAWGIEGSRILALQKNASETQALTGLQRLNLSNNQLSGTLPVSWAALRGVRELRLANNQFSGAIADEFSRMTSLNVIDITNNAFTALPNLSGLLRLDTVRVGGNALGTAALAPNAATRAAAIGGFVYLPQRLSFGTTQATTARLDESTTVSVVIPAHLQHAQNRYLWLKNAVPVRSASMTITSTGASLTLASLQATDAGEYQCVLTNTTLTGFMVTSASIRLAVTQNTTTLLPGAPMLVSPSIGAIDIALQPTLVWATTHGTVRYEMELSSTATFIPSQTQTTSVEASSDKIHTGIVSTATVSSLAHLQVYFWRVRGVNSRGAGAWSSTGTFTTIAPDAAFALPRVEFGTVPRLDTAHAFVQIQNLSKGAIVLERVLISSSSIPPNFSIATIATTRFAPEERVSIPALFFPQNVGATEGSIRVQYRTEANNGALSELQTLTLGNRLAGTGLGLKVLAPTFDTVLVGQTRVVPAFVINRGLHQVLLNTIVITSSDNAYDFASDFDNKGIDIGIGDTTSVLMKCTARVSPTQGQISLLGGTVQYSAIFDEPIPRREEAASALTAYSRERNSNDPIARVRVRASSKNLSPGSRFTLDVVLDSANSAALIQNGATRLQVTLRYNRNVITLASEERGARRLRNTSTKNSFERIALTPTTWDGRTTLLAQVQCVAVAGEVDTSVVEIEQLVWQGASLEEFRRDTVRLNVCEAGGKRLVTSAKAAELSLMAPNPAKDVVTVTYTLREDGAVSLVILDARGDVVQTLVQAEQAAGEYSTQAIVKTLPSGSYTVRLEAAGAVKTQRLNVVR